MRIFINGSTSTSALALIKQLAPNHNLGMACRSPHRLCELLSIPEEAIKGPFEGEVFPKGCQIFQVDANQEEEISFAVQKFAEPGPLDGFAHFPGSVLLKPLHSTSTEDWQNALHTNLTSAFFALKACLVPMRRQGFGSVVLLSSVAASRGLPNHEAIAAAKSGVEALARTAAATYPNIRFNCVAPGLISAKATQKIVTNERALAASVSLMAIKRAGAGEEVASAVQFLLSETSSFITGQVLGVDGGMSTLGFPK